MTADEILTAPTVIAEPRNQYEAARGWHQREAFLAHMADRHQDWLDNREAEAVLIQFGQTEIHPSTGEPERLP